MKGMFTYLPVLKWRQGEYQALMRLAPGIKDLILPLIVIPPVEYDFEEQRPKKSVQEHISPFAKRFAAKWGGRMALVDLHESLEGEMMPDGTPVVEFVFSQIRMNSVVAVPVVRLSQTSTYLSSIKAIVGADQSGIALRVKLTELMSPGLDASIRSTLKFLACANENVDLIVDLEAPQSFEPYKSFAKALSNSIKRISSIGEFRSFFVVGTSLRLSEIKKPGDHPSRHEWLLYQQLKGELAGLREPMFGDYTIESPEFLSLDMRRMNPAGKIVYTTDIAWLVVKGGSFRLDRDQMVLHCGAIVNSGHYFGRGYSDGDKRIYDTYVKKEGTGNQTTWKEVGVSHHLTLVANQTSRSP